MSTFEDDRYQWRETYFVLFDPEKRPKMESIRTGLQSVFGSLHIRGSQEDELGQLEMLSVASYEDFAAIDMVYREGDQVIAEMQAILEELVNLTSTKQNRLKIMKAGKCSAKLDVMHFEQMIPIDISRGKSKTIWFPETTNETDSFAEHKTGPFTKRKRFQFDPEQYIETGVESAFEDDHSDEAEQSEHLNPNTLIQVLELLCLLTDGIAIDPASGAVL